MRLVTALAVLFVCLVPSLADAPAPPWVQDGALLKQAWSDALSKGLRALDDRVDVLEAAVARGRPSMDMAKANPGQHIWLTDGPAETLAAMMMGASQKDRAGSIAIPNPYPQLALLLGSYYNEVERPADALRVLDLGLTFSVLPDLMTGAHMPDIEGERGAAFIGLKRWPDALAAYDAGLKGDNLPAEMQAHLQRGRGFALTELGRLDEAEAAYRESLRLEPGNEHAQNELDYIARLRAGAPPAPTQVITVGGPPGPNGVVPLDPKDKSQDTSQGKTKDPASGPSN